MKYVVCGRLGFGNRAFALFIENSADWEAKDQNRDCPQSARRPTEILNEILKIGHFVCAEKISVTGLKAISKKA